MKKTASACAVASALALFATAQDSKASGFALYEQGVSGLGNAYAGAAAVAEDATTVWWNPAGMSWLEPGKHLALAVTYIQPKTTFKDQGSVAAAGRPLGDTGGDAGHAAWVPSGFFAMDLGRGWSAGFGISVPFGLKTEYTPTWLGRFQGISSEIKTVNYNPSVAYKLNDTLSLGAGIDYIQGEINFLTAVNLGVAETQNRTHVEGDAWGFNAGLIAKPTPRTNVGVHYRSTMKFNDLTGTTEFGLNAAPPLTSNGAVRLDNVRTPDSLALSVAQTLTNEVQLLGDVTWWHWSRINQLPLVRTDGPLAGTPQGTISTLNLDFKDTLRWSAGMKYKMSGVWTMKLGVAFDQSPVKDSSTRTVVLPDNDRWWATVGFKYVPSKNHAIDFGYAFVKVQDADINSNQAALGHGVVTGRYSAHVNTIGAQYQFSF